MDLFLCPACGAPIETTPEGEALCVLCSLDDLLAEEDCSLDAELGPESVP
jgi:hypothetical protein